MAPSAVPDIMMADEVERKVEPSQSVQTVKNVKSGMQSPVSASIGELMEELQISPSTTTSEYSGPNNVSVIMKETVLIPLFRITV